MRGREKFQIMKPLINLFIIGFSLIPKRTVHWIYDSIFSYKGVVALGIRYCIVKRLAADCGDNVSIHRNLYLFHIEKMSFGSNVSIHPMSYLDAGGEISIGNDVSIAHSTTIMSASHSYDSISTPIKDQPLIYDKVTIEDNVWIGAKATILKGVSVGYGSVIGACSLVNKSVPPMALAVGIPARVLKNRALHND